MLSCEVYTSILKGLSKQQFPIYDKHWHLMLRAEVYLKDYIFNWDTKSKVTCYEGCRELSLWFFIDLLHSCFTITWMAWFPSTVTLDLVTQSRWKQLYWQEASVEVIRSVATLRFRGVVLLFCVHHSIKGWICSINRLAYVVREYIWYRTRHFAVRSMLTLEVALTILWSFMDILI